MRVVAPVGLFVAVGGPVWMFVRRNVHTGHTGPPTHSHPHTRTAIRERASFAFVSAAAAV